MKMVKKESNLKKVIVEVNKKKKKKLAIDRKVLSRNLKVGNMPAETMQSGEVPRVNNTRVKKN